MAAAGYQLKSDLARVCLPVPERAGQRRMAWANSLCLLFLLVGVLGEQSRLPALKAVPPLEQPAPVIVEPAPQVAVPAAEARSDEQPNDSKPDQRMVAVTLDTPAINFAVPTSGNLLVPLSVAPTPVETPLKQAASAVSHLPAPIQSTGNGGDRPAPYPYPPLAAKWGQQGTVILLLTVDDLGKVISADIRESSGSQILDDNAREWVRRYWIIPPANGGHLFLAPIKYELHSG